MLAMIVVKNFLAFFWALSKFSVGMRSSCLFSTSFESGRIEIFEIALSFQERVWKLKSQEIV